MARSAATTDLWQKDVNRSWGLTVLKTAYREMYPDATCETILDNSQKVEETVFTKAKSKMGYDQSVSKAIDSIRALAAASRESEEMHEEIDMPKSVQASSATGSSPPNDEIILGTVRPMDDAIRRVKNAGSRKSLTPVAEVSSRNQLRATIAGKESADKVQTELGMLDFFSTRVDASDVIKLVPFILQASVQVVGRIETIEQAQGLTERQKSSIGFLGMEKMSRALERAAKNDNSDCVSSISKYQPLRAGEEEEVLLRAKRLRQEYMKKIRTIYAMLGEEFDNPDCDETMILNIGQGIKKLDAVESDTSKLSKQTVDALNYVENVFKAAIEQYGHLLRGRSFSSNEVKASSRAGSSSGAGPSNASHFSRYAYERSRLARTTGNPRFVRNRGRKRLDNGDGGGDDEEDLNRHRSSHYTENADPSSVALAKLKAKYRQNIKALIPLVEAEIGDYEDVMEIQESMAYAQAVLNLEKGPDEGVLRNAEKTIEVFYNRFCHLLPGGKPVQRTVVEPVPVSRRVPRKVARKTVPAPRKRSIALHVARMTAPPPQRSSDTAIDKEDGDDYDSDSDETTSDENSDQINENGDGDDISQSDKDSDSSSYGETDIETEDDEEEGDIVNEAEEEATVTVQETREISRKERAVLEDEPELETRRGRIPTRMPRRMLRTCGTGNEPESATVGGPIVPRLPRRTPRTRSTRNEQGPENEPESETVGGPVVTMPRRTPRTRSTLSKQGPENELESELRGGPIATSTPGRTPRTRGARNEQGPEYEPSENGAGPVATSTPRRTPRTRGVRDGARSTSNTPGRVLRPRKTPRKD